MKPYVILLLCVFYQSDLTTGDSLDFWCNLSTYISSSTNATYVINDSQQYARLCHVKFTSTATTVLVISGPSLDCSMCHVSVWDGADEAPKPGGDTICSADSFTRTYRSDSTGDINLHVQGSACASAGLVFKAYTEGCEVYEFQCDNYECVESSDRCDNWNDCSDGSDEKGCASVHIGVYVGAPIGALGSLAILASVALGAYRRRVMVPRRVVMPANQAAVSQSRW